LSFSVSGQSTLVGFILRPICSCQLHTPASLLLSASYSGQFTRKLHIPASLLLSCQRHTAANLLLSAAYSDQSTIVSVILRPVCSCELHTPASLLLSASYCGQSALVSVILRPIFLLGFIFRPIYSSSFSLNGHSSLFSFIPRPLYRRGKSSRHPVARRLGGPQGQSARVKRRENFVSSGNRPRFLSFTTLSLVIALTTLSRLLQLIQSETFTASVCGDRPCE
jgi:hypothetical protein